MSNIKIVFSFLLLATLISCGKNDEDKTTNDPIKKEAPIKEITPEKSTLEQNNSSFQTPADSIKSVKESVLTKQRIKKKEDEVELKEPAIKTTDNISPTKEKAKKITASSFVYLKKILENCKTGQQMTQKDLETKFQIPKEAMKLVKSVTKTADNELDVKWKSTWLVEKVSDAKFKDGKIKMRFDNNKMYMSGGAIGIKYENKIYTDLVLIGRTARIPSVKGYHWQIGKN